MSEGVPRGGPGTHMLRGSIWMIGLRWAIRLTGVVSTVILARLLTPSDFGVVAIAMIVVGLFEMLNMTGQGQAIIRHGNPTPDHYNTAWTVSVIIGFGIGTAILIAAPLSKIYFHDPRSVPVMQCLALRAVLSGFENIGTLDFRRDLRFERLFGYNVYARLLTFVVTVTLAFVLRNYWALVAGMLTGQLARTALSYVMHSYRPRFSLSKMSEIWSFSIWTFARAVGGYLLTRIDIIAIGGIAGSVSMGRYTVAQDVASSPTAEISEPMGAVLFPVMARYQHDPAQLKQLYLRVLGWSAIIGGSTGMGVLLVAPDMVHLVLGQKWLDVTPLMGWLALAAGLETLRNGAYALLDVLGLPHVGARMQWLRVLILAAVVFPVTYLTHDLVTIAASVFAVTALFMPTLFLAVGRKAQVTAREYGAILWRPFAASATMALAVWLLNRVLPFAGTPRLVVDILVGAAVFGGSLIAYWRLSGRPVAAERDIIALIEMGRARFGRAAALPEAAD